METLTMWGHYLEGADYKISIRCDHKNLDNFNTSKVLSRRQARWLEIHLAYDIVLEHLERSMNSADGPSRRPDYEIPYERPVARLLATVSVVPYNYLMPAIIEAQASDNMAVDVSAKLVDRPMTDGTDHAKEDSQWKVVAGVVTYNGRIYFPVVDSLH
jgi:hypothetical protein